MVKPPTENALLALAECEYAGDYPATRAQLYERGARKRGIQAARLLGYVLIDAQGRYSMTAEGWDEIEGPIEDPAPIAGARWGQRWGQRKRMVTHAQDARRRKTCEQ